MCLYKRMPEKRLLPIILFLNTLSLISGCHSQHNEPVKGAGSNKTIKELMERIEALENIIEGTAHPINLGRTSLAKVDASSVNGGRLLNDVHYGIQNAFDDGQHWYADVNYTNWTSGFEIRPWIEIQFEYPVTITSIFIEQAPPFTTTFYYAEGGQTDFKTVKEQLTPGSPIYGVNRVKFSFDRGDETIVRVFEVRVLGYPPQNVKFTEEIPDLVVSDPEVLGQCEKRARKVLDDWKRTFLASDYTPKRQETENSIIFTFGDGKEIDYLRVIINKKTHLETIEELVQLIKKYPDTIKPTETIR